MVKWSNALKKKKKKQILIGRTQGFPSLKPVGKLIKMMFSDNKTLVAELMSGDTVTYVDIQWRTVTYSEIRWRTVTYSDVESEEEVKIWVLFFFFFN